MPDSKRKHHRFPFECIRNEMVPCGHIPPALEIGILTTLLTRERLRPLAIQAVVSNQKVIIVSSHLIQTTGVEHNLGNYGGTRRDFTCSIPLWTLDALVTARYCFAPRRKAKGDPTSRLGMTRQGSARSSLGCRGN